MGLWNDKVLPRVLDKVCGAPPLDPLRKQACAGLHGTVVEFGFGTGTNLKHMPLGVTRVLAVEPSDEAWKLSEPAREASPIAVERIGLDGASIALDSNAADGVLSAFTLCTIPDIAGALAEAKRILKPGARIHLVEHGKAPNPSVARWQERLNGVQGVLAGGCNLTRDPEELLAEAGFEDLDLWQDHLPGVPSFAAPWTYVSVGSAKAVN